MIIRPVKLLTFWLVMPYLVAEIVTYNSTEKHRLILLRALYPVAVAFAFTPYIYTTALEAATKVSEFAVIILYDTMKLIKSRSFQIKYATTGIVSVSSL